MKNNDAVTMARILADDFVLMLGNGKTYGKADLLEQARTKQFIYEHQEDSQQVVRVWGDTAVVTALLWANGKRASGAFDENLWFSDVYVRTATGWSYAFGQASLYLPHSS